MKRMAALLTAIALGTTSITTLHAADVRYSEWKGSQTVASTEELIQRLNTLIDTAERQRAADPRFLEDLRDALDAYGTSQVPVFIKDNFTDGDITRNPAWTIATGKFGLEKTGGLRSIVRPAGTGSTQGGKQDTASSILDTILGSGKKSGPGGSLVSTQRAEIFTAAKITNSFDILGSVLSRNTPADFEWVVYQGADRSSGYRLNYSSDAASAVFELSRFSRKGTAVIDGGPPPIAMEDGGAHKIGWKRAAGGLMTITFDGEELFSITDQGIKSGFDGIAMVNNTGDVLFRDIEVRGF